MWGGPASRQLEDEMPSSSEDRPARERRNLHSSLELPGLRGAETGQPRPQSLFRSLHLTVVYFLPGDSSVFCSQGSSFLLICLNVHF